jgi:hypothetical protein
VTPLQHAKQRAALAARVRREFRTAWARVEKHAIRASWTAEIPRLLALLTTAQQVAAASADAYVAGAVGLEAQQEVVLGAFSHIASDGRPLESLLLRPSILALQAIQFGHPLDRSLAAGQLSAELIGHTQTADAGRTADLVAVTANRAATGYVRLLVGRTCARCMLLAGRRYSWKADFKRHPRCFPAGVVSSGPGLEAAARRWYQGELVVITTASGEQLPATGNHPVLTDRGWLPINLLQEGDHVVRCARGNGATAVTVPNKDHVPTPVEDLWGARGVRSLVRMPTAAQDFHGDGGHGDVDVVFTDRLLMGGLETSSAEPLSHEGFSARAELAGALDTERAPLEVLERTYRSSSGVVGGSRLPRSSLGGHLRRSSEASRGAVSDLDALLEQVLLDGGPSGAVLLGQLEQAIPLEVPLADLFDGERRSSRPRWDAPDGARSAENATAYSSRGLDLLGRLAGQVELDRVVNVRRTEWSGHVYSLTSSEGWHSANSLIVSNCDCTVVPTNELHPGSVVSPEQAFREMLPSEQDKVFGKAGAASIRAGADIGQVVNARRGMESAAVFGRNAQITTEGTTRRRRFGAKLSTRRPRLMPEQIIAEAKGDRDEAIRLLSLHGYIR